MKLEVLAFGAHPDDVEISSGGTLLSLTAKGMAVGLIDLTRGEMGTRGTAEIRHAEAEEATKILGASVRENLGLPDSSIKNDHESQIAVIRAIRKYQPRIVLAAAIKDRHPDHENAAQLVEHSCFLSGLKKIGTNDNGVDQLPWRPTLVLHYIQALNIEPDIILDISDYFDKKMASILAHRSQFYDPNSKEPKTFISSPEFLDYIKSRAIVMGTQIGVKYGEGFTCKRNIGVHSLSDLL